jgi:tetratricopeptide (TPR) repeat protein
MAGLFCVSSEPCQRRASSIARVGETPFAAFAKFGEGKEEEAALWASRSIDMSPDFMTSHFVLAAALASLGRMAEAREAVRAGLDLDPTFTIARYRASTSSDNPRYLAGLARILDALRKAGVPEG